MTTTTFELPRRTGVCAATGRTLQPGEEYVGALFERPDEAGGGLERRDYSRDAWESAPRHGTPVGFWRGKVSDAGDRATARLDPEAMLALFEQLSEATEPRHLAFRYVLALILIRKRLLVLAGSRPGALLVQHKLSGAGSVARQAGAPVEEVTDPGLDEQTVGDVTGQLEQAMRVDA